jgi:lipooligosaccharide transport system permease protein
MSEARTTFLRGAWQVTVRNFLVWRSYAGASIAGNFGEPILYLVAMGYGLGRMVPPSDGMTYAEFIAPGLIVSTVMYTATLEMTYGAYTRLTVQATYDAILATPITAGELVAGELLWGGLKSLLGAACELAVIALFGLAPSWWGLWVLPVGFVAGVLFAGMALTVTGMSKSYEFFNYYFTLIVSPMFLFSGIFFPLERVPEWARTAAQLLPLTHVVEVSRALVRGSLTPAIGWHLLALGGFLVVVTALCSKVLRRRLSK